MLDWRCQQQLDPNQLLLSSLRDDVLPLVPRMIMQTKDISHWRRAPNWTGPQPACRLDIVVHSCDTQHTTPHCVIVTPHDTVRAAEKTFRAKTFAFVIITQLKDTQECDCEVWHATFLPSVLFFSNNTATCNTQRDLKYKSVRYFWNS
jgi:hypothetical protein